MIHALLSRLYRLQRARPHPAIIPPSLFEHGSRIVIFFSVDTVCGEICLPLFHYAVTPLHCKHIYSPSSTQSQHYISPGSNCSISIPSPTSVPSRLENYVCQWDCQWDSQWLSHKQGCRRKESRRVLHLQHQSKQLVSTRACSVRFQKSVQDSPGILLRSHLD